jgi:hypothetical protein
MVSEIPQAKPPQKTPSITAVAGIGNKGANTPAVTPTPITVASLAKYEALYIVCMYREHDE